ncbi:hypothetical protein QFC21_007011 [Naganishia friedmannii]|uniref:Uncharacterized protein n=1 Tax=Naganishia friedmannii TaxID=89922 RepID=A0ACC2UZ61_9TREE|nr:hypothetical protein QFC21_007011 [Naganishia friedmannii]
MLSRSSQSLNKAARALTSSRASLAAVVARSARPVSRLQAGCVQPSSPSSSLIRAFSVSAVRKDQEESTRPEIDTPPSLYTFTEEEEMLRETVRKFANEVVKPRVYAMDEAEQMDPDIIKALFDQGLMGIETSADHDGSEMSFMAAIIVVEGEHPTSHLPTTPTSPPHIRMLTNFANARAELAKVDPSISVMCDVHNTLVNSTLRLYGNEDVKARFLPRLATDTVSVAPHKPPIEADAETDERCLFMLGSFCLSEPASGSDAFALQTTAKLDESGDNYILNGSKMQVWITNSAEAGIFLVFANVDPSKGYKGITCFALEKEMGVVIAKKEKKLGIKASSTCLLSFDDVKVPKENVVGEVGKGYKIAIDILNEGRIGIAAQMIGLAQGAFDQAVTYAYTRKQFGKAVGDNQGMAFQFADVLTEIEAARLLTYNAARLKEQGKPFVREAAMAKYYASNVAQRASGMAIEWAGGVGFTREVGLEKYWRDSKIGAIYEGTSNIQLETIAKLLKKDYV